jgi:hypothetical protein
MQEARIRALAIAEDEEIKALRVSLNYLVKNNKKYRALMKRCDPFLHYADRMNGKSTN